MVVVESSSKLLPENSKYANSHINSDNNVNNNNNNGNGGDDHSSSDEEIENVHRLVQDENAKTILLNVPLEDYSSTAATSSAPTPTKAVNSSKPPRRPLASPRPGQVASSSTSSAINGGNDSSSTRRKLSGKHATSSSSSARVRSASVGRDKHSDTQARYWAFLFENLRRAVDDLYKTCESDECIPAVKEVILVFENYVRDFRNLANWLKLNREYENTPPLQRPTSLAWEVRKTPPASGPSALAKLTPTSVLVAQRLFMATPAKRALDFDMDPKKPEDSSSADTSGCLGIHKKSDVSEVIKEVDLTPVEAKENDKAAGTEDEEKQNTAQPVQSNSTDQASSDSATTTSTAVDPKAEKTEKSEKDVKASVSPKSSPKSSSSVGGATPTTKVSKETALSGGPVASSAKLSASKSSSRPNTTPNVVSYAAKSAMTSSRASTASSSTTTTSSSTATSKKSSTAASSTFARTKSNSSSNLYNGRESSSAAAAAAAAGPTGSAKSGTPAKPDVRQNRVSLMARQSKFSSQQTSNSKSNALMTRSATSATLSGVNKAGRVVAFGRGIVINPQSTSSRFGTPRTTDSFQLNRTSSSGAATGQLADSNRAGPAAHSGRSGTSGLPFGSTSSISSSSSNRSWADTVRGRPSAPRSVENLSVVQAAAVAAAETAAMAAANHEADHAGASGGQADDDAGWETVRPRARSKFSPLTGRLGKLENRLSKDPKSGSLRVKHSARGRFDAPSSAVSLPSIAILSEESSANDAKKPRRKSDHSPEKRRALKQVKSASGLLRRDRSNLERISGSDTGSSQSSAEDLHNSVVSGRKNSPVKTKLSRSMSSKSSNGRKTSFDLTDSFVAELIVPAKSPSPLPSQDDDGGSDVMDSEIAKRDVAIALAEEEERSLAREIQEMEKSEMPDVDTDGDQASASDDFESDRKSPSASSGMVTPPMRASYPPPSLFEGLSWADQMDLEEQLQESRYPGRAIQIHEKLSSPARKREPLETFRHHQEKQKNAKIRRERFQEEKAQKLLALNARIEEVVAQKNFLIQEKRDMMSMKMARAEIKRQEHIDGIRKKAREEDAKLKEIAFINELQAQNARIDALAQTQTADVKFEERLAELAEERHKKQEQQEAKKTRAEERRKAMEEKRQQYMEALREKIRSREERIQEEQELARKERREAAREKARDREEKLSTVRAAERDMKEELHEKILQKHQEATRRHQEKLELIRQKAFELSVQRCDDGSVPKLKPYDPKKKCSLCLVLIDNEVHLLSHLRGRKHAENVSKINDGRKLSREELHIFNIKYILDAPAGELDPKTVQSKERQKTMKKKAKKLKARMLARAVEFESSLAKMGEGSLAMARSQDAPNRAKIGKSLRDIEKVFGAQGKGAWPNNAISAVERALGELLRTFEKNNAQDKLAFYAQDGFGLLSKLFTLLAEQRTSVCIVPLKTIALTCRAWGQACAGHRDNTEFVLKNNHLSTLADILMDRLLILMPDSPVEDLGLPPPSGPQVDPVAKSVMSLLTNVLEDLRVYLQVDGKTVGQSQPVDISVRTQDQVSYIVAIGIVDKLAGYFHSVQDPIEDQPEVGEFLLSALQFVSALTGVVEALTDVSQQNTNNDPTHLWAALQATDLAGTVSMLYGMLLHQGGSSRDSETETPPKLPDHTLSVSSASLRLLHRMVRQRLAMVQEVLSQECISLEFRHIASYLLSYCQTHNVNDLLHLTIVLVGYFAAKNTDNQVIVQSGQQPSVLQQLCSLPFVYFSQPELKRVLFPTLLACCHNNVENTRILSEEMNWQLIEDFLRGPDGKLHLVELILS